MKFKNLNIRKAFFTLGFAITLTGCTNTTNISEESSFVIEEIQQNNEPIQTNDTCSELNELLVNEIVIDPTLEYPENSYTTVNLNLRDSDSLESNVITVIDKCQKVAEIMNFGEWSYVKYNDISGYVYNDYLKPLPEDYIEVDISDQNIKYHVGEDIILDSDVVTGKQNVSDTRIGMFEIYSRETSRKLNGVGYSTYVDYWMPFDGGIGLHDASWRSEFGGDIYIYSGSHGCVNLPFEIAKTIYENSKVGTKVLVHQ